MMNGTLPQALSAEKMPILSYRQMLAKLPSGNKMLKKMIRFLITGDANIETGVGEATLVMTGSDFYKFIENKDYSLSLKGLCVIFMYLVFELNFKQRIMYSKKIRNYILIWCWTITNLYL